VVAADRRLSVLYPISLLDTLPTNGARCRSGSPVPYPMDTFQAPGVLSRHEDDTGTPEGAEGDLYVKSRFLALLRVWVT
jgi:hypothetical protein